MKLTMNLLFKFHILSKWLLLLLPLLWFSKALAEEQFLNAIDFFNANFVDINQPVHTSVNDQRFPLKVRSSALEDISSGFIQAEIIIA